MIDETLENYRGKNWEKYREQLAMNAIRDWIDAQTPWAPLLLLHVSNGVLLLTISGINWRFFCWLMRERIYKGN